MVFGCSKLIQLQKLSSIVIIGLEAFFCGSVFNILSLVTLHDLQSLSIWLSHSAPKRDPPLHQISDLQNPDPAPPSPWTLLRNHLLESYGFTLRQHGKLLGFRQLKFCTFRHLSDVVCPIIYLALKALVSLYFLLMMVSKVKEMRKGKSKSKAHIIFPRNSKALKLWKDALTWHPFSSKPKGKGTYINPFLKGRKKRKEKKCFQRENSTRGGNVFMRRNWGNAPN